MRREISVKSEFDGLRLDEHSVARVREMALADLAAKPAVVKWADPEEVKRLPAAPTIEGHTYLYIVKSLHAVKIGHAANLYIRISNMRVDNPHCVEVIEHIEAPREIVRRVEAMAHDQFAEHCVSGEWFAIPVDEAQAMVRRLLASLQKMPVSRMCEGG